MIETILTRPDFVLTLSLDDESGAFKCECTPPNQAERQEVRKITRSWVSHIGRGRAHRLTGRVPKVKVINTWSSCRCHGVEQDEVDDFLRKSGALFESVCGRWVPSRAVRGSLMTSLGAVKSGP
jgi:hypothetical protein